MATRQELIIATAADQRALDWLVLEVGWESIDTALAALPGKRKPYVSNLAKELHLAIPRNVFVTPAEQARPQLKKLLQMLKRK
jgi:hypothetical protein